MIIVRCCHFERLKIYRQQKLSAPTLDSCVVFGVIIIFIEQHFPTNSPLQIQISDLD